MTKFFIIRKEKVAYMEKMDKEMCISDRYLFGQSGREGLRQGDEQLV